MKNLNRTLIMLIAAALAVNASAERRMWNFSDGLDGWALSGGWETKRGVLQQTADDRPYSYAIVGDSEWDVRYISAKVRIDAPFHPDARHKIGVIFRANFPLEIGHIFRPVVLPDNVIRCYAYELLPWGNFNTLMTARINERGVATGISKGGVVHGIELKNGEWYRIEIVLEGKNIDFFINDFWQRNEDEADYVEKGAVGFFTFIATASFDNLIVEGENLRDRFSVQPNGKLAAQWARLKRD